MPFLNKTRTQRRKHVDRILSETVFEGDVLDVGGKKHNKRGLFSGDNKTTSWKYLNIDETTKPDYLSRAEKMPIKDHSFDTVLLSEVIEHLEHPVESLREIHRVLRPEGKMIMTSPFMYGFHGNPQDYQRWTTTKIKKELAENGFEINKIVALGSLLTVIHDLIYTSVSSGYNKKPTLYSKIIRRVVLPPIALLDRSYIENAEKKVVTSGYFVEATKIS